MNKLLSLSVIILMAVFAKAQVPTATIVVPSLTMCTETSLTFTTLTANTPTAYTWGISPSTSVSILPDLNSSAVALTFLNSGSYIITLTVTNASGSFTTAQSISVTKMAHSAFNATFLEVGFPTQLNLTNYSTNAIAYNWLFSDVAGTNTVTNIVKTYTTSGSYSLSLISYGAFGCNDTSDYSFRISDSSGISLPNVFTPNNDSINDVFKPKARGIKELKLWVYNRYGVIIYYDDKINCFWDGYTTSGEPCQAGIYFSVCEAVGFDGKSYKVKGNITLIR
ncbi:MAG: gliding motility-associated C-terminal domain-containing protein [Bacteroidota bacterium]|nr:gliding motility-associated C-terminal domain-containing protein [Bacteroidota bacterium]